MLDLSASVSKGRNWAALNMAQTIRKTKGFEPVNHLAIPSVIGNVEQNRTVEIPGEYPGFVSGNACSTQQRPQDFSEPQICAISQDCKRLTLHRKYQ